MNVRRVTGAIFMMHPPLVLFRVRRIMMSDLSRGLLLEL
jgi:hypothetical protein